MIEVHGFRGRSGRRRNGRLGVEVVADSALNVVTSLVGEVVELVVCDRLDSLVKSLEVRHPSRCGVRVDLLCYVDCLVEGLWSCGDDCVVEMRLESLSESSNEVFRVHSREMSTVGVESGVISMEVIIYHPEFKKLR